jgi:transposase-like protein
MAAVLHGSARTTPRVRAELQAAQASSCALAAQYGLNPKTVLKWRKRSVTVDAPMGPKARSTVLTEAEETIIVEFRRRTLLPLDDVLGCLHDAIPKLTRSALHRCLVRHGISRLPQDENTSSKRKPFKDTKVGYVHIDSAQSRSAQGETHMVLAVDRVSKFVYVEFHATAEMATGGAFMPCVVAAYNFAKHLKALRWRTPFQAICDAWKTDPTSFKINPHHLTSGLYT